eukprot:IDg13975t1
MKSASNFIAALRQKFTLQPSQPATGTADKMIAPGSVTLGLRLLSLLNAANGVVSPICISQALQLTQQGASSDSPAYTELATAIGGGGIDASSSKVLTAATAAFVAGNVRAEFKKSATNLGAHVAPLPKNVDVINSWVDAATKGRISSVLNSLPGGTCAVLISAVHFAAPWARAFNSSDTSNEYFNGVKGEQSVRMMQVTKCSFDYTNTAIGDVQVKAIRMPYGGDSDCSAVLVLPVGDATLDSVVKKLGEDKTGAQHWSSMCASLERTSLDRVALPRFHVEWGGSLVAALRKLGVNAVFDDPVALSMLAPGVVVSDVLHKACIDVDEKGTVAAAVTAVVLA